MEAYSPRRAVIRRFATGISVLSLLMAAPSVASSERGGVSSGASAHMTTKHAGADLARVHVRLAQTIERCGDMEFLIRDLRSGGVVPFGEARSPDRRIFLPNENPNELSFECYDGYLLHGGTPPLSDLGPHAGPAEVRGRIDAIRTDQKNLLAAIRAISPDVEVVGRFRTAFNGLHVRMTWGQAAQLLATGEEVWINGEVKAHLNESVPLIRADQVWDTTDQSGRQVRGRGVTIAILDTGIDYTHIDLGAGCFGPQTDPITGRPVCKVVGGYDVINEDADPIDDHGHGTHVAAIAAGTGTLNGVAPEASLLAYKVVNAGGFGTWDSVIEGIERAVDPNQDGNVSDAADVMNLSLGGPGTPDDPVSLAVDAAVDAGTTVVVAAGNSSVNSWDEANVDMPGVARDAITVGATTKQDSHTTFSSRGPVVWNGQTLVKPDLAAPGEAICAARWSGWNVGPTCIDSAHVRLSGTSMAAPHVAGTAALLLQADPSLSTDEVKAVLKGSAPPLPLRHSVVSDGAGRVDALSSVQFGADPPVALLDPISDAGPIRRIQGRVLSPDLASWRLDYAPYRGPRVPESGWTSLTSSNTAPASNVLHDIDIKLLQDGEYILRLQVTDASGRSTVDYGYMNIDKIMFTNPLDRDVQRLGTSLPVQLDVVVALSDPSYVFEYARAPTDGSTPIWNPISSGPDPSTSWNLGGITSGDYYVRATVSHDGIADSAQVRVTLDSTLRQGFPWRVSRNFQLPCPGGSFVLCPLVTGWADPVVTDLDGDGSSEFVFLEFGESLRVRAFTSNGDHLWSTSLGSTAWPGWQYFAGELLHSLAVTDADHDGNVEIYAVNLARETVYQISHTGSILRTYVMPPLGTYPPAFPRLSIADVDADGSEDLVVSADGVEPAPDWATSPPSSKYVIHVWDIQTGLLEASWQAGANRNIWLFADYSYMPAIGDIDGGPELEIISAGAKGGTIDAYDYRGTRLWSVRGNGGWGLVPPVIGDVDGDGKGEVIAALHNGTPGFQLFAIAGDGRVLPGWPINFNDWPKGGIALGDLDSQPGLEIVATSAFGWIRAFTADGTPISGYTRSSAAWTGTAPLIADISGEATPEVIVHRTMCCAGLIEARGSTGSTADAFPKLVELNERSVLGIARLGSGSTPSLVATSESDYALDALNRTRPKHRFSFYAWDLPGASNLDWPVFQHDVRRTGNADGGHAQDAASSRPVVTATIGTPAPTCCVPPENPAAKPGDNLAWQISTWTRDGSTGQLIPCSGCVVEKVALRQFAEGSCFNAVGNETVMTTSSYAGPYHSDAESIRLSIFARASNGAVGYGVSNCVDLDQVSPTGSNAWVYPDMQGIDVVFNERVQGTRVLAGDWFVEDELGIQPATVDMLGSDLCAAPSGCSAVSLRVSRALSAPGIGKVIYMPPPSSQRFRDRVGLEMPNHETQICTVEGVC